MRVTLALAFTCARVTELNDTFSFRELDVKPQNVAMVAAAIM